MEIAFLGTGAAFSSERFNCSTLVDRRWLFDAGAPLLPQLGRLGYDPGAIRVIFITHFHGDHLLGLPPFVLHRGLVARTPLTIVVPEGGEERLESLFRFCWLGEWDQMLRERSGHDYLPAGSGGEVDGLAFETVALDHGPTPATGYRVRMPDGRLLAYAGDTQATPPLERLVAGADVVVTEATGAGEVYSHTSWEEAAALRARHPGTRFLFNHVYAGSVEGAVSDLQVVTVPPAALRHDTSPAGGGES